MEIRLVSTEHGYHDFDVADSELVKRVTVDENVKKGDLFNIYLHGGNKIGGTWKGEKGVKGYLIGDLEDSINTALPRFQAATEKPKGIQVCSRCKTPVVFENVTDGYVAVCPEHDEDLLSFEIETA